MKSSTKSLVRLARFLIPYRVRIFGALTALVVAAVAWLMAATVLVSVWVRLHA